MNDPHFQRGLMLYEQGRHEMAETEFKQALASNPDDAMSHALLGLCMVQRKAYKEATEETRLAIHLWPALPFAHYALASVHYERNRYPEALEAIAKPSVSTLKTPIFTP